MESDKCYQRGKWYSSVTFNRKHKSVELLKETYFIVDFKLRMVQFKVKPLGKAQQQTGFGVGKAKKNKSQVQFLSTLRSLRLR